ncbi:hypothetical protein DFA_10084 [Cavenderia fasciculata]|uniref:RRM domain-containing protein n=1 Tax=Cavenderia fasciculata TaxID=261658 RepID=F4Q981_CACFS|nr:uncharacterized protein DFA_10084 [Cavenderia fasciculata]EGG15250.1 hypothetical protein DFA_10084 [Cavenderia fasciculata]|eukprot:XP_004351970.1 hypothetical protein DFA_10084 [Cavenderia fasciculata]
MDSGFRFVSDTSVDGLSGTLLSGHHHQGGGGHQHQHHHHHHQPSSSFGLGGGGGFGDFKPTQQQQQQHGMMQQPSSSSSLYGGVGGSSSYSSTSSSFGQHFGRGGGGGGGGFPLTSDYGSLDGLAGSLTSNGSNGSLGGFPVKQQQQQQQPQQQSFHQSFNLLGGVNSMNGNGGFPNPAPSSFSHMPSSAYNSNNNSQKVSTSLPGGIDNTSMHRLDHQLLTSDDEPVPRISPLSQLNGSSSGGGHSKSYTGTGASGWLGNTDNNSSSSPYLTSLHMSDNATYRSMSPNFDGFYPGGGAPESRRVNSPPIQQQQQQHQTSQQASTTQQQLENKVNMMEKQLNQLLYQGNNNNGGGVGVGGGGGSTGSSLNNSFNSNSLGYSLNTGNSYGGGGSGSGLSSVMGNASLSLSPSPSPSPYGGFSSHNPLTSMVSTSFDSPLVSPRLDSQQDSYNYGNFSQSAPLNPSHLHHGAGSNGINGGLRSKLMPSSVVGGSTSPSFSYGALSSSTPTHSSQLSSQSSAASLHQQQQQQQSQQSQSQQSQQYPQPQQIESYILKETPSRTLFVGNISASIDDESAMSLFSSFGPVKSIMGTCKHRGFIIVDYYDIRHAMSSLRNLHNTELHKRKLDIRYAMLKDCNNDIGTLVVFNLDPSMTNQQLTQIFGVHGQIKEIRETPNKAHHKFIEYYDTREAAEAIKHLNKAELAGKRLRIQYSRPGGNKKNLCNHSTSITNDPYDMDLNPLFEQMNGRTGASIFSTKLNLSTTPNSSSSQPSTPSTTPSSSFNQPSQLSTSAGGNSQSTPISSTPTSSSSTNILSLSSNNGVNISSTITNNNINNNNNNNNNNNIINNNTLTTTASNVSPANIQQSWSSKPKSLNLNNINSTVDLSNTTTLNTPTSSQQQQQQQQVTMTPTTPNTNIIINSSSSSSSAATPTLVTPPPQPPSLANEFQNMLNINSPPASPRVNTGLQIPIKSVKSPRNPEKSPRGRDGTQLATDPQYILSIDRVKQSLDTRTSLMIKNLPNRFTQTMLLSIVDENFKGTYDFLYLPIDPNTKVNYGYAFINFVHSSFIVQFFADFNSRKWEKFYCSKVCEITYARIQGKLNLIQHLKNPSSTSQDKGFTPNVFIAEIICNEKDGTIVDKQANSITYLPQHN